MQATFFKILKFYSSLAAQQKNFAAIPGIPALARRG
jgi:hypothetical protein